MTARKPDAGEDGDQLERYKAVTEKDKKVDKVVWAVRKDLLQRSELGIVKYGTTLDENGADLRGWLQHAYEEALDMANYLKCAIMKLDGEI